MTNVEAIIMGVMVVMYCILLWFFLGKGGDDK